MAKPLSKLDVLLWLVQERDRYQFLIDAINSMPDEASNQDHSYPPVE